VTRLLSLFALVTSLVTPVEPLERTQPPVPPQNAPRPCASDVPCCPAVFKTHSWCRIGCPGPPPKKLVSAAPDMGQVAEPYPSGVAILELAIDEQGVPVSSCVLRGIRKDFDRAAQLATLRWRFTPMQIDGKRIGVVISVTVTSPRPRRVPGRPSRRLERPSHSRSDDSDTRRRIATVSVDTVH
jgi:TonB family protein